MFTRSKMKSIVKRMLYRFIKEETPIKVAIEDNYYNPYDGLQYLKDIKVTVIDKDYAIAPSQPFTLITPVKNEAQDILLFLNSIENQTLLPSEVIIVDGGSIDGTPSIIREFAKTSKAKIRVIKIQSTSISQQRNIAINEAKNEIIVMADAGNVLDKNYCKNMVGAMVEFPDAELVGALFYALHDDYAEHFIYGWDGFEGWNEYLPAAKTMAVRRSIFLSMGGFPEFLKFTGEDALFDLYYRNISTHWVFNKAAYVYWDIPRTWEDCLKKFYSYGVGYGESHMGDAVFYLRQAKMRNGIYSPEVVPITEHMFSGYLFGREKRAEIEFNIRKVDSVTIILSKNQLQFSKLAWEKVKQLINNNNKVIYISSLRQFPQMKHIDFDFTLLELYDLNCGFSIEDILRRYGRYIHKMRVEVLENDESLNSIAEIIKVWRQKHEESK
ncbi:glycosyltransferase [Paenibacillus phoenicis]|uniref:Glycosyltransferase n=1 Tax=Paenibacillus phoenicis TaxID=554117 RepID=A0ABU5PNP1_9BACL|nr:glycosyltransferase [Paenibacillus phoenicis]MEA3571282.1 glycosyltransferase [Paenibacillus phoenicis]